MMHAVDSLRLNTRQQTAGMQTHPVPDPERPLHPMLHLQRHAGNQSVLTLLRSGGIRPKLEIGGTEGAEEQEADAVADRVMRKPLGGLGGGASTCAICGEMCEECQAPQETGGPRVRRSAWMNDCASDAPPSVQRTLVTSGRELDPSTRSDMETRFGRDFGDVRIYTDEGAAESAAAINARAYTVGSQVVFGEGQYAPQSDAGGRLLAHELAHVLAQREHRNERTVQKQSAPGRSRGRVLFVQVDRTANTIRFVTESGTLSYPLLSPTEVPVGSYRFSVAVSGNNLTLTAPGEVTNYAPFRYRISQGQPNPASLLRGESHVDVMVVENGSAAPASSSSQSGVPATATDVSSVQFQVQVLDPNEFMALTGLPAETLPEGSLVSGSSLSPTAIATASPPHGQDLFATPFPSDSSGAGWRPGVGGAAVLTQFPSYPIPPNATGIIWTQVGAGHLSEFANVGGSMLARGFRYDLWMNLFPGLRETGLPGSFQNDFFFTLMPNQTIVYRNSDRAAAEAFAERLLATRYNETYQFPPRPGSGVEVCGKNCITAPAAEVTEALGVRPEILTPEGPVDILRAGRPTAGAPFEASQAGRGSAVREWLAQDDAYFAERGLTRAAVPRFTPAARGAVGFIKVGGAILMIYGAYRSVQRISQAPEAERPRVISEEAGSWVGGLVGSALGSAGAAALVCLPAGPVDFICVVGGFAGGLLLGALGSYGGAAAGGAFSDWISEAAGEAYRRSAEAQGDQFPPGSEGAVDWLLGPPVF